MLESMLNAFRAPDIRRRLLFVLGILVIYRALSHRPNSARAATTASLAC